MAAICNYRLYVPDFPSGSRNYGNKLLTIVSMVTYIARFPVGKFRVQYSSVRHHLVQKVLFLAQTISWNLTRSEEPRDPIVRHLRCVFHFSIPLWKEKIEK